MRVLSLFDGMGCTRIALDRADIPVTKYYASEIDKYAIQVAQANYPDIEQLGDVTNILKRSHLHYAKEPIDCLLGVHHAKGLALRVSN